MGFNIRPATGPIEYLPYAPANLAGRNIVGANTGRGIDAAGFEISPPMVSELNPARLTPASAPLGNFWRTIKSCIPYALTAGLVLGLGDPAYAAGGLSGFANSLSNFGADAWSFLSHNPALTALGAAALFRFLPMRDNTLRRMLINTSVGAAIYSGFGPGALAYSAGAYLGLMGVSRLANRFLPPIQEENRVSQKMPWLPYIPDDADIPVPGMQRAHAWTSELGRAVGIQIGNIPAKAVDILREVGYLSDPSRRNIVGGALGSLMSTNLFNILRLGGTAAVWMSPYVDPTSKVAAAFLLMGEFWVRIPTSMGYQRSLINATKRDGDYYYGYTDHQVEQMVADTNAIIVHYGAQELDVVRRSAWGAFLVDHNPRTHVWGANSDARAIAAEIDSTQTEIMNWSLNILENNVLPASAEFERTAAADGDLDIERERLVEVLGGIRDQYEVQGDFWMNQGTLRRNLREPSGVLDQFLGGQWYAHVSRLQGEIDRINGLRPDELEDGIRNMYQFLSRYFNYNLIVSYRPRTVSVDVDLFARLHGQAAVGMNEEALSATVDQPTAQLLLARLRDSVALAGFDTSALNPAAIDTAATDAVTNHLTARQLLSSSLIEWISLKPIQTQMKPSAGDVRDPSDGGNVMHRNGKSAGPRVGGKSFSQSSVYDHFGRTFVQITTSRGTSMELSESEWTQLAPYFLTEAELQAAGGLQTGAETALAATGIDLNLPINADTARVIVNSVATSVSARRALLSTERAFVENHGTGRELLTAICQSTSCTSGKRRIRWQSFPNPEFVLSFDKDYVARSIAEGSGMLIDGLRVHLPRFLEWQADGRVTIAVAQGRQHYALDSGYELVGRTLALDQIVWYGASVEGE